MSNTFRAISAPFPVKTASWPCRKLFRDERLSIEADSSVFRYEARYPDGTVSLYGAKGRGSVTEPDELLATGGSVRVILTTAVL